MEKTNSTIINIPRIKLGEPVKGIVADTQRYGRAVSYILYYKTPIYI